MVRTHTRMPPSLLLALVVVVLLTAWFHDAAAILHNGRFAVVPEGKPAWSLRPSPIVVTYAFSPVATIKYLAVADVRGVFQRSFARWASVIPVSFVETDDYATADVKVGFYAGEHGDGYPFDGPLGDLAHTFTLEGEIHLDASELWVLEEGLAYDYSSGAMDLESVVTHEIGHIIGLDHSTSPDAVMYPDIGTLERKTELSLDDVQGAQLLYGPNPPPDFTISMSPPPAARTSNCFAAAILILVKIIHM